MNIVGKCRRNDGVVLLFIVLFGLSFGLTVINEALLEQERFLDALLANTVKGSIEFGFQVLVPLPINTHSFPQPFHGRRSHLIPPWHDFRSLPHLLLLLLLLVKLDVLMKLLLLLLLLLQLLVNTIYYLRLKLVGARGAWLLGLAGQQPPCLHTASEIHCSTAVIRITRVPLPHAASFLL